MIRIVLFLLALSLLIPPTALADGCFVWKNRQVDILEPEQKAVIVFDKGWEDLILEVKYEGPPVEFGWIVPVPSRPEMKPARASLFEELSMRTQERRFGMSDLVQRFRGVLGGLKSGVEVLERKRVGIYDTTVLASDDGRALREWVRANAFQLPDRAAGILDEYARKGWVFVVMKIAPQAVDSTTAGRLASGTIQPIRFRFPATEPVYPLRISSINGGKSEVLLYLLADDQYVNRTLKNVVWENRMCGPTVRLSYVDPDSHYAVDGYPTFFVSKLRATIESREMEDVTFQVFDPVPGLSSRDRAVRAEAASYIGWKKRRDCAPALITFLRQPHFGGQDVCSAMWALGKLGSPEAVPVLLRWARWGGWLSPEGRLQALASLSDLRAREALPLLVEGLARKPRILEDRFAAEAERRLCLDALLAFGDRSCIEPLWRIAAQNWFREAWDPVQARGGGETTPGLTAVAALAGCGDSAARQVIVDAILGGRRVVERDALVVSAARGGSDNGFPTGFWIGTALVHYPHHHPREWPGLYHALELLPDRPDVLDGILRQVAADDRVSDCGRALLLGCLRSPGERDREVLHRIWLRALGLDPATPAGPPVAVLTIEGDSEMYNLAASAIVYAYTRFGDVGELRRCWAACPAQDHNLRGDIAAGLARCGDPADLPRVTSYVARDWNRIVSEPGFEKRQRARESTRNEPLRLADRNIDQDYRNEAIKRYIGSVPGGDRAVEELFSDRRLHPYLRLHWMTCISYRYLRREGLRAAAVKALGPLQAEVSGNKWLDRLAADTRTMVERMGRHSEMPED